MSTCWLGSAWRSGPTIHPSVSDVGKVQNGLLEDDNLCVFFLMYIRLAGSGYIPIEHRFGSVQSCKLDRDDSASESTFDTNVAGTLKAITSTNKCLSHHLRAPAAYPIDIRYFCPRVETASAIGITGDNKTDETTEERTWYITLGLNHRGRRRRTVLPRWLDGWSPLYERQYSNKRVWRGADVSESMDGTIRRKNPNYLYPVWHEGEGTSREVRTILRNDRRSFCRPHTAISVYSHLPSSLQPPQ